jgi:hypothetical protein
MTSFGNGVSRTLTPELRKFLATVFQKGKPPLDSELNFGQQIQAEALAEAIRSQMPSGWLLDPTRSMDDFQTSAMWSNHFVFGNPANGTTTPVVWAVVNGWLIPVAGTGLTTAGDVRNKISLYPAPQSASRIDFVFLEVWQALIQSNPSVVNKPSATKIWKFGNVEYGQTNIDDDLLDGTIGRETTRRVQLQYRLRVFGQGAGLGASVSLDKYPDGIDDPNILGQGTASSPVAAFVYTNMRETLGDASLWRAGDGNANNALGTVDGYTYAIPLCAVFRRNSQTFTAVNLSGNPNNNGSFDRNPSAMYLAAPRAGAKVLATATLVNNLAAGVVGVVQINGLLNSGIDDTYHTLANMFLVIGSEIVGVSNVTSSTSPGTITIPVSGRGRGGTQDTWHAQGTTVEIYSARPDSLFADQVVTTDILDLRRTVSPGDWDYQRLLLHNLANLAQNRLRSTWKVSGTGDTLGTRVVEVDLLHADGSIAPLNHTAAVDGPDGIRTVFSDAASLQTDVTLLLDNDALLTNGFTTDQFDSTVSWDVGAGFKPSGFMNNFGSSGAWTNGSTIFLHIGGDDGTQGARATFRDGSTRAVRFVSPTEYWKTPLPDAQTGKQSSWSLRFLDQYAHHPLAPGEVSVDAVAALKHPGPYYPLQIENFERPFVVLGGTLKPSYKFTNISSDPAPGQPGLVQNFGFPPEIRLGVDFDLLSTWETRDLLGNRFTLSELFYGGVQRQDAFGTMSQLYVVLYGDTVNPENNGAFRVIGGGTIYTPETEATDALSLRLMPLDPNFVGFTIAPGQTLTAELRSTVMTVDDGTGFAAADASVAIVLTDISGFLDTTSNPWGPTNLGSGTPIDYSIGTSIASKLQINCTLLYNPGRGATTRIPDDVWRVSLLQAGPTYLRQAVASVDASFAAAAGLPVQETFFDSAQVQLWNRLPSLGLTENAIQKAPSFGGRVVAFSEQDREHELFIDRGSKTAIFRPYQDKVMTLQGITTNSSDCLLGDLAYPDAVAKDGASIFTTTKKMGFPIPSEFMPRFGRQDIPYYVDISGGGLGSFLEGISHLFTDSADPTEPQFSLIGGRDNTSGGNLVHSMLFQTGTTSGHAYGVYGTIVGPGTSAYQARLTSEIGTLTPTAAEITRQLRAVQSSDLGAGLVGIQLPPYLGIARLYGVYDRADYIAKGGQTFGVDRVTPVADPPTNLLRVDAKQQTLFILQNGAKDRTLVDDDHTYIIPSNAIDVTKSPYFSVGVKEEFTDFEFVVECCVFGFAQGWINSNNYVLTRKHNGAGALLTDGSDPELENIRMTLPSPAILNDRLYVGYSRTPYQGDPYMTREGSTRTLTDYASRYGQVSVSNAYLLNEAIEQFDVQGHMQVETPNARAFEVLAAIDFYTTLGTGKVGGELYPGTMLDVGYTENTVTAATRLPSTNTQPAWSCSTRAFSEGQQDNRTHASISLDFFDYMGGYPGSIEDIEITIYKFGRYDRVTGIEIPGYISETFTAKVMSGNPNEFDTGVTPDTGARNFLNTVLAHPTFMGVLGGYVNNNRATLTSYLPGDVGNKHQVQISYAVGGQVFATNTNIQIVQLDKVGFTASRSQVNFANFAGGLDLITNAGNGSSQLQLTGFTERLPLGILLQDSDFLSENPLNDTASSLVTMSANLRPVQTVLPLTLGGNEYDRFLGDPGELISLSDGGVLRYAAYNSSTAPAGTKRFRIFRGGGSVFVLSGDNPGGPVDWVSESWPSSVSPVLKGGVLTGKALLVRNYPEVAFATQDTTSKGDELQMVVLTYGILGNGLGQQDGIQLDGVIGVTGYGDGYAAADRYRIEGKPMYRGHSDTAIDPNSVTPAVYPGRE